MIAGRCLLIACVLANIVGVILLAPTVIAYSKSFLSTRENVSIFIVIALGFWMLGVVIGSIGALWIEWKVCHR